MSDWLEKFEESLGPIRLSEYIKRNEAKWHEDNDEFLRQLFLLLQRKTGVDFYQGDRSQNVEKMFSRLAGMLLYYFQKELYESLAELGSSGETFEREVVFGTMLSVVRQRENVDDLMRLLKDRGIIRSFSFQNEHYMFDTIKNGIVNFAAAKARYPRAWKLFEASDLRNSCHKYTERFLAEYPKMKAVTCTQNKSINLRYYHSFILDGNDVVDVSNDIVMEQSWYYYLTGVSEINRVDYAEFMRVKNESVEFDESRSLFPLLRTAVLAHSRCALRR